MASLKRRAEDEEEEEENKRIHIEEEVISDGGTIYIQQEDGQYATIIQDPEHFTLEGDEGEMTIHIAEEGVITQDAMHENIVTEGVIMSDQVDEEQVMEGHQVMGLDDGSQQDDGQLMVEQIGGDDSQLTEGLTIAEAEGESMEDLLQYQNLIIQHMDISEPLMKLRKLLEVRLQCSLNQHEFWLQDTIPLEPTKNLVSQCVQGSGMVQINVEVKSQPGMKPRLNIVDILKPAEEIIEMKPDPVPTPPPPPPKTNKVVIPFPEENENVTRWIVDQNFRKEQERLKIPFDPHQWNNAHVKHWLQWSIKEFKLKSVNLMGFNMSGKELCSLTHDEFIRYIPNDKGDIFWTHLELLRKCKFVAVIQQPTPDAITTITVSTSMTQGSRNKSASKQRRSFTIPSDRMHGNRTGNNGQIQLWQFLLELLTDKDYRDIIHWVADDGEFKLANPEMVAQLWGQRKNKPSMNYEKLSRALRYYYDGDMIAKVHGKRFVYKFVCDLKTLLGYSAAELNRQVLECLAKRKPRLLDIESHEAAQAIGPLTISQLEKVVSMPSALSGEVHHGITSIQPAILKKVLLK